VRSSAREYALASCIDIGSIIAVLTEAEGDCGIGIALDGVYGGTDEGVRGNPLLEAGDVGTAAALLSEGGGVEVAGGCFEGDGIVVRASGDDDNGMVECCED
jgi:hypothetical protein